MMLYVQVTRRSLTVSRVSLAWYVMDEASRSPTRSASPDITVAAEPRTANPWTRASPGIYAQRVTTARKAQVRTIGQLRWFLAIFTLAQQ